MNKISSIVSLLIMLFTFFAGNTFAASITGYEYKIKSNGIWYDYKIIFNDNNEPMVEFTIGPSTNTFHLSQKSNMNKVCKMMGYRGAHGGFQGYPGYIHYNEQKVFLEKVEEGFAYPGTVFPYYRVNSTIEQVGVGVINRKGILKIDADSSYLVALPCS